MPENRRALQSWGARLQSHPLLPGIPAPAANYWGEIVEWAGWALAAWPSLPAAAFALFTFANLAPRGARHHQWCVPQLLL